jgi:hypothetical protein
MLPKIDVPIFTLNLPLSKKTVRYRPFLVKEEKLLLMAMESNEESSVITAIKQIVTNCSLDEIDVEQMPVTDVEYFFLNLRARSVGEIIDLQYKCNNKVKNEKDEENDCNNIVKFKVNILEIVPEISKEHTNKIVLTDKLGLVMRYPSLSFIENIEADNEIDKIMKIILKCVDSIYDAETIYYTKDITESELVDFIDSLTKEQFAKIQVFFETMPKLKKMINFKCDKCGYEDEITVEGIQSFFV